MSEITSEDFEPDPLNLTEPTADRQVFERWRAVSPGLHFGQLAVRAAHNDFLKHLYANLEVGEVESWLHSSDRVKEAYVVKAMGATGLGEEDVLKWKRHQPDAMEQWTERLGSFERWLAQAEIQPVYRAAYEQQIAQFRLFTRTVGEIGTPQTTVEQQSALEWSAMLDVPATLTAGTAVLPYEKLAREVLKTYGKRVQQRLTMAKALGVWRLNEAERLYLLRDTRPGRWQALNPKEGMRLFEVLLNRLGLSGFWQVRAEENRHSIEVDAAGKMVLYPQERHMNAREVTYLPFHELVHVVGGHNGTKQECGLLSVGLPGYLATEEGIAMMAEILGGSPFGYERHVMIAARYVAVAMMLKAKRTGAVIEPVYCTQEIYDTLRGYGISQETAGKIVWRTMRGTSLGHEGVEIKMRVGRRLYRLPVAEAFVRDEAYFRGFVRVLTWVNQRYELLGGSEYVSCQLFGQRVCRKHLCMSCELNRNPERAEERVIRSAQGLYEADRRLRRLGREGIIQLIQFLRPGKLQLQRMVNTRNPWYGLLSRDNDEGRVWYGDVLRARGL